MRRYVGVLAVVLAAGVGAAATSSTSLPSSTVGYQSVRVTGATMTDISYTIAANTISAFTVKLRGTQLLKVVSGTFSGGLPGTCVVGLYDATSNTTPVTCTGFAQRADTSWTLQITVS